MLHLTLKRTSHKDESKVVVEADNVSVPASIQDVGLTLTEGEVVGFAGLLGSGRSETAKALFGIDRISDGTISVRGNAVQLRNPAMAIKHKIAFCPEDRKSDAVVADLTVRENIALALQGRMGMFKYLSKKKQKELADKYIKLLGIATPDAEKNKP